MRHKLALAGLAIFTSATNALAQEPVDWSGWYAGGSLSRLNGSSNIIGNRWTYDMNRARVEVNHALSGAEATLYGGWIAPHNSAFVWGVEASLGYGTVNDLLVFNADNDIDFVDMDWTAILAARFGYAYENTLFYGKIGVAATSISTYGGDVDGGVFDLVDAHSSNKIHLGAHLAVGIEHALTEDWSIRGELSATDYGSYRQRNADPAVIPQIYRIDNGPMYRATIGLTYRF